VGRDVAFSIGVASVDGNLLNHLRLRATKPIENFECMRCWIIKGFGGDLESLLWRSKNTV